MELELSRVDYAVVGVTSTNCMKILPKTLAHETQRVALADGDGILQVFSVKKENINMHFKTLPGPKISSLQLGGMPGTPSDKIFVTSGNEVRGYTSKGKLFLSFDSNMTESITSMYVMGSDLFVCGKHIYNHYRDCKDVGSYLCGDCIVDVIAYQKSQRTIALIACEGRMIRALEHARVTMTIETESSPTVLHIYENDDKSYVLFGTVDGRIGILDLESQRSFDRWLINDKKLTSMISCIFSGDMAGNGIKNLIVGRQDGNIEVYNINIDDPVDIPISIFSYNCNESITAIQCGIVGNQGYQEILVATYTGRIFGLTSEPIDKTAGRNNVAGNYVSSVDTSNKIAKLRNEIEDLKLKVAKEREKYEVSTQSFTEDVSAIPLLEVKHTMTLSKQDSSYILILEAQTPIDNVFLQSNVPVDLLDVEKNSAVVSYSEAEPKNGNFLLATYRCQINTNRLELKIRTIEGQYGTFQAYITPLMQLKCCRLIQYDIKPLSLHSRIYTFDDKRPFNVLNLKGPFSLAEIHSWIAQCFPEVPEKPQFSERTMLTLQSTFLDTIVHCSYIKNEADFKSDNVSSISILKDYLTKEATKKKIKIDISVSVNDESIAHILKLVDPKLQSHKTLSNQMALLNALKELETNDEETTKYFSTKYKNLLACEKETKSEFESMPSHLDRLYGTLTDLYVDYYKLKAVNVKSKVPKLLELLDNYNYESLLMFFCPQSV